MHWLWIAIITLLVGFVCMKMPQKKHLRALVWIVPVLDIAGGYWLVNDGRPWYKMLAYIFLLFLGMKAVTATYRYPAAGRLNLLQWLAYSLGWPGMDPAPFEQLGKGKTVVQKTTFVSGIISFVRGILLLFLLANLLPLAWLPNYVLCLLSFIPIIMIFHAGLFNIGAAVWALVGVNLTPLMDAPWRSNSVSNFWGRRWNIAFIQMTRISLFMPLAKKGKPTLALLLSFFISGIFHEVALTLPVGAGYGLPMCYFVLQALFVLAERKYFHLFNPFLKKLWTILCLMLPFPLLLHPAFIHKVMIPFLQQLADLL
jgi:hypothetical protein